MSDGSNILPIPPWEPGSAPPPHRNKVRAPAPFWSVHSGDCLEYLPTLPENFLSSIVTDPPYEIGFMGKRWDETGIAFDPATWGLHLRALRPGGHLLSFGHPRTVHRIACAIEDAGFQIRGQIYWAYGTGKPVNHDISKKVDKLLGAKRKQVKIPASQARNPKVIHGGKGMGKWDAPFMKKAREVGYHLLDDNTPVTEEAKKWYGWNTDIKPAVEPIIVARKPFSGTVAENILKWEAAGYNTEECRVHGRWPANFIIDDLVRDLLELQSGNSYIFYVPKARKGERTNQGEIKNDHPTCKPVSLMSYLVRLVTPPGGVCGDFFAGSGSTGVACMYEAKPFIGCELDDEFALASRQRIQIAFEEMEARGICLSREEVKDGQLPLWE